jgi:hypothetical protein
MKEGGEESEKKSQAEQSKAEEEQPLVENKEE